MSARDRNAMLTRKEVTELITDYLERRLTFMQRVSEISFGFLGRNRLYANETWRGSGGPTSAIRA